MSDRLYRSIDDRAIAGVCGGLADRLNLDPALVRIGFAVLAIATGIIPFVILYVVMVIVVPEQPTWDGVRPVGSQWDSPWSPGSPSDAPWESGWSATQPPGVPPRPDAVPGWVPPGWSPPQPGWSPPQPGWNPTPQPGWSPPQPGWNTTPTGFTSPTEAGPPPSSPAWDRRTAREARRADRQARRAARRDDPTYAILAGIFLVGIGAFFLLRSALGLDWELIWPAIVVTLGVLVVIAGLRPRHRDE